MKLRFIALHMMYDRIAPELPTNAPVMIIAVLWSVKPMAAAAQPEYELSIETTTGISAPPMGMMSKKPMMNDKAVTTAITHRL